MNKFSKKTCVLIPLRAGSKGLPGKNKMKFRGKPLYLWTVEQALEVLDKQDVIILTDDDSIIQNNNPSVCTIPYKRSEATSSDYASTESVIMEFLCSEYQAQKKYESIVLLQATSPLRRPATIAEAIHLLDEFDSVLALSETHKFSWFKNADGSMSADYDFRNRPRRQELVQKYHETGSLYAFSAAGFSEFQCRLFGRIGFVLQDEIESFEIDTLADFKLLELLGTTYE